MLTSEFLPACVKTCSFVQTVRSFIFSSYLHLPFISFLTPSFSSFLLCLCPTFRLSFILFLSFSLSSSLSSILSLLFPFSSSIFVFVIFFFPLSFLSFCLSYFPFISFLGVAVHCFSCTVLMSVTGAAISWQIIFLVTLISLHRIVHS